MKTNIIPICNGINLKEILKNKGYAYFEKGNYNLNIVGVRRNGNVCTNDFNDALILEYKDKDDRLVRKVFPITTTPGLKSLKQIQNYKGCAILVPGQYRSAYKIGLHKGKYKALCQAKPLPVYRDNNKDDKYDFNPSTIDTGIFGINIHKAGTSSIIVDGWSAGCQVFAKRDDFNTFMTACNKQIECGNGSTFTYTLLTEDDII